MRRTAFTPANLEQASVALVVWQDVQDLAAVNAEICRREGDAAGQKVAEWFEQWAKTEAATLEKYRQELIRIRSLTDEELEAERQRWLQAEAMVGESIPPDR